jgi:hypothetical protein
MTETEGYTIQSGDIDLLEVIGTGIIIHGKNDLAAKIASINKDKIPLTLYLKLIFTKDGEYLLCLSADSTFHTESAGYITHDKMLDAIKAIQPDWYSDTYETMPYGVNLLIEEYQGTIKGLHTSSTTSSFLKFTFKGNLQLVEFLTNNGFKVELIAGVPGSTGSYFTFTIKDS